jgi:hypothetical protein
MLSSIKLSFCRVLVILLLAASPTKATRSVSAFDLKQTRQAQRHGMWNANKTTYPKELIISSSSVPPGELGIILTLVLLLAGVSAAKDGDHVPNHGVVNDSLALSKNVTNTPRAEVTLIPTVFSPPTHPVASELNDLTRQLPWKIEESNIAASTQEVIRVLSDAVANGIEFSEIENIINEEIVDIGSPEITESFYTDIKYIGGGSMHKIFKARLNQDRGKKKVGQVVALRVRKTDDNKAYRSVPKNLKAYGHIAKLRELGVTNYIPEIYGVYYTPFIKDLGSTYVTEGTLFVSEFEYLDTDYETAFGEDGKKPRDPRVAFEEMIGRWAIYKIANAYLNDADGNVLRHYMLKKDPNYALYTIGEKSYLFPPGYSPRQIDFDDFHPVSSLRNHEFKNVVWHLNSYQKRKSVKNASMKRFLDDIPTMGLFESLYQNLSEFELSETNQIPAGASVSYFHIPDEYIYDE